MSPPCALIATLSLALLDAGDGVPDAGESAGALIAKGLPPAQLERELAGRGAPALPAVVAHLGKRLEPETSAALRGALHGMGPGVVVPALAQLAGDGTEAAHRAALLDALACVAGGADLDLAVALAAEVPDGDPRTGLVHQQLERVAAAALAREPAALGTLDRLARESSPAVAAALVRGAAEAAPPSALAVLARLLGEDPALDAALLSALPRAGRHTPPPLPLDASQRILRFLHEAEGAELRAALHAAGELEDMTALPRCVELLDHPSPPVRDGALRALERMTGRRLPADGWKAWLHAERTWFQEEASGALEALESGDRERQLAALQQLVLHRYRRHEIALRVAGLLRPADDPQLFELACAALRQLGSRATVPDLARHLQDRDAGVVEAARRTLAAVTGLDLAADDAAWRELARGERPGGATCACGRRP